MYSQPLTPIAPGGNGCGLLVEAEEKLYLDLRIGRCGCASEEGLERAVLEEKRESLFSEEQFHELCNQILIFHSYPTFRGFRGEESDHSSMMDSEPGRCRRTDGRKWRCSKNVVSLQKYCERHMHRGRQGSRKHVEPVEKVSGPDNRARDDYRMPVMSLVASDIDNRVSVAIQSDHGEDQPRPSHRSDLPAISKCRNHEAHDAIRGNDSISVDYGMSTNSSSRTNCSMSGGDDGNGNAVILSSRKQNVFGNNYAGFSSPRYGLSPKSVLNAAGKVGLGSGFSATIEPEQQRCRRTDGKKWQCRRDALHNQKYCDAHMHRGAKRLVLNPEYSRCSKATPTTITKNLDRGINLNTVPSSPQHGTGNNSSSSTSDATTITDENISICLGNSVRPD